MPTKGRKIGTANDRNKMRRVLPSYEDANLTIEGQVLGNVMLPS